MELRCCEEKALQSQPVPTPLLLSYDYTLPFGQDFWQFCNMSLADIVAKFTRVWHGRISALLPEFLKKQCSEKVNFSKQP